MGQIHVKPSRQEEPETEDVKSATVDSAVGDIDGILDDIDSVLEANAEEFVSSYVQLGGE